MMVLFRVKIDDKAGYTLVCGYLVVDKLLPQ